MNCKELAYMLADYFDGSMDPRLREELDTHLDLCEPCKNFMKTFRATCEGTRKLRETIGYEIPPEVHDRLETFFRAAALKYPEKVKEYRDQVERERREKVRALVAAAVAGRISSITALLVEAHCGECPECREYFESLRNGSAAADPPAEVRAHAVRLMQSLPPGEEFFLA